MSGAERKSLRAEALAALAAVPRFASWRALSAWQVFGLDDTALPAYGLATPDEAHEAESHSTVRNRCQLVLALKRTGGELIEDDLDDDADAAASAIQDALREASRSCDLTQTNTKIDASGIKRAGSVELTFSVIYWVDDPE